MKRLRFSIFMLSALAMTSAQAQIAASASADRASDGKAFYSLSADGEIQIGPDGRVTDYRIEDKLQPAVAALVKRAVTAWRFEPIVVDGKAVVAKTAIHLDLNAEPAAGKDDEFTLRIADVVFGNPGRRKVGAPPQYPRDAAGARLGAYVILAARLDGDGHVAEIHPYQTSLDARAGSEREAERWRRTFEKAAIKAVKTWQYDMTEIVGGHTTEAYVRVPVRFFMSATSNPGNRLRGYEAGPIYPVPWETTTPDQSQVTSSEDAAISTSSRFHLTDDVIGKAL